MCTYSSGSNERGVLGESATHSSPLFAGISRGLEVGVRVTKVSFPVRLSHEICNRSTLIVRYSQIAKSRYHLTGLNERSFGLYCSLVV